MHEDIAIAAYLILLWRQKGSDEEVRFVDMGCGNGLLVYILAQEGFRGYGLDIRSRRIWSSLDKADLRVSLSMTR